MHTANFHSDTSPKISSDPSPISLPPLAISDYLSCLQVVMVNTTLPANIGSAARAMHTMGLSNLTVVDPKHPIDETSISHAAGASEVLANAHISATLESAIGDCQLVFAASSRSRHLPRPVVTPTQAAQIMLSFIDKQTAVTDKQTATDKLSSHDHPISLPKIAILFGREDRGLTNDELAFADYHIQIDANPDYPVLNVASAVQVIASFIFTYTKSHVTNSITATSAEPHKTGGHVETPVLHTYMRQEWDEPAITQQQLQQLTDRTTQLMTTFGLADSNHLRSLPSRLSRLASRLQLDQKEYQLLSALMAKLQKDKP